MGIYAFKKLYAVNCYVSAIYDPFTVQLYKLVESLLSNHVLLVENWQFCGISYYADYIVMGATNH